MDVIPALTELAKGGATGKKQIDRYTRYLAVVLSFFQASTLVYSFSTQYKTLLVNGSGWASILYVATLLTAGSMFILWIGDRISMKGIGNGVSMIIAAGIISRLPYQFTTAWQTLVDPSNSSATFNGILTFGLYIVSYLLIIVFVVILLFGGAKIPELMRGMGRGVREFKDAMNTDYSSENKKPNPADVPGDKPADK